MIENIEINNFKCFEKINLRTTELTLLSGSNASGKSSLMQALVLLHQTIKENELSQRLILNGDILNLGTVQDVVNKVHGRHGFDISITYKEHRHHWKFSGNREEMSMKIEYENENNQNTQKKKLENELYRLLPFENKETEKSLSTLLENLTYITAERIGPQDFYPLEDRGVIQTVGPKGEHTISRIYHLADHIVHSSLVIGNTPPNLMRQVEAWMQYFFPGCGIEVTPIARMNAATLGIRTSNETDYHRPINVGFGLTQVLPIIVAVLSSKPGELILIENPEVHLHPAGQALMGSFLALAASTGIQIILETHSDHVLNGVRRTVRNQSIKPKQVCLYFFRQPCHNLDQVVSPQLDELGNIDYWPEGFFDQFDKDMNHLAGWE